ncbi:MAG: peptidase S58 family protein [Candidatus Abyssobacteria bacterium SURF_17]|uniref:Peptidase S58 family protein n=1 Tax=Candidatus Abyssobacteria bacterium SURF_17 TaxID=2093361 RepID=A0A419EUV5_9BACT|nr:MAG: peptidase S58 family protein [Candidatus Abyssubacteria bacterium SURF_17]
MRSNFTGLLTDVGGLRVGHVTDNVGLTGCTVVICDAAMTGGVDVRGSATGTREIELLRPTHLIQHIHAIVIAGGSAYGLAAGSGVMRYLEEHGRGYNVRVARVPIVPAAILFDLALGDPTARPDAEMGYRACSNATNGEFPRGNVGAGTGATVGKVYGMAYAMKAGIGTACVTLHNGAKVGALVAVNAFGDVRDPETGKLIAGARNPQGSGFADTEKVLRGDLSDTVCAFTNTVIALVATNARLTKEETNKLAQMANNGIARTVAPAHTTVDGDVVFALSTAETDLIAPVSAIGSAAAQAVAHAIMDAVMSAESAGGIPAARDFHA